MVADVLGDDVENPLQRHVSQSDVHLRHGCAGQLVAEHQIDTLGALGRALVILGGKRAQRAHHTTQLDTGKGYAGDDNAIHLGEQDVGADANLNAGILRFLDEHAGALPALGHLVDHQRTSLLAVQGAKLGLLVGDALKEILGLGIFGRDGLDETESFLGTIDVTGDILTAALGKQDGDVLLFGDKFGADFLDGAEGGIKLGLVNTLSLFANGPTLGGSGGDVGVKSLLCTGGVSVF